MFFRKHPIVMRKGLVFGMFGPLLGVLPATFRPELGFGWFVGGLIAGCVLGVLFFFPSWMNWHFTAFRCHESTLYSDYAKGLFSSQR